MVEAVCLFVGYPRSGHSLVGSLLDAHPDVVIAHEAKALQRVTRKRLSREELFALLLENSRGQAERAGGRRASGYSYVVPGQWQGRTRMLRVIGDKTGAKTTRTIGKTADALEDFERVVGVPVRLIHVVRNPYDVVARMALTREDGSIGSARERFARLASINGGLIAGGSHPVLTIRHENVVRRPKEELAGACEFLGVEADDDYLDACASIVFESPNRTRSLVEWPPGEIEAVRDVIDRHSFLAGYDFEGTD
jgi:hypothetical protein